ncbi:glycosyltransferase family 2 protein, partial [Paenibacillus sp. NPDC056579]|uniref:glycosyltransferase family 2 protein n=1 Tax=Paenibacillus sp. NPDC056579 TaxID=3345871 RepID=UPI00368E4EC9
MYRFCFVILHYNAVKDTVECIESIINNIQYNNTYILVVDNNSPDGSGKYLMEKYKNIKNVLILLNDKNSGFARGNNIGYKYASGELKADFVAVINNDTVIRDKYFIEKIIGLYDQENFQVMGPDIITKDGYHQNPFKMKGITLGEVNDFISNYKKQLIISILITLIKRNKLI